MAEQKFELDPVKYELFYTRLEEALIDAMETIKLLSASEIVREANEAAEVFCIPNGESALLSAGLLAHVASVTHNIRYMIKERYEDDIGVNDGDQFLGNDCHIGGMHIPDMMVIAPLFYEEKLIGWLGNYTHVPEMGAIEPGGVSGTATEFWHEGICVPCVKIVERGKVKRDFMNMLRRAVRDPRGIDIDTRAKIAGNERARRNIIHIIEEVGVDFFMAATKQLVKEGELQAREKIKTLQPGKYRSRCYTDCVSGIEQKLRMVEIEMDVSEDGHLTFTAPSLSSQAAGYNNCAYPAIEGLIFCTLLWQLFYKARWNSGCLKAMTLDFPTGSMISADASAAVGYCPVGIGMQVMGCLNDMVSRASFISGNYEDMIAHCSYLNVPISGGLDRYGRQCAAIVTNTMMTGGGARHEKDGQDTSVTEWNPWTDFGDVEAQEVKTPIFHLGRRHIPDSGGFGRYRGGSSGEMVVTTHASKFPLMGQMGSGGYVTGVQGMYGGYPAPRTALFLAKGINVFDRIKDEQPLPHSIDELLEMFGTDVEEVYPSYQIQPLQEGEIMASQFWGGGGSGDPIERDPQWIAKDIRNKLTSLKSAKDVFCISIDPETLEVNKAETEKLRDARKKERLAKGEKGQDFVARQVKRRKERDLPIPVLQLLDEVSSFSEGFLRELEFEEAFAKKDMSAPDIKPVKDCLELTPYIKVVEDEKGEQYCVCSRCNHVYAGAEENFKLYALISDRDPEEVHPGRFAADKDWMIYREFYCPGCGSQIEVEATAPGSPILHNIEI